MYTGALSQIVHTLTKSHRIVPDQHTVYWKAHIVSSVSTELKNCRVNMQFFKGKPHTHHLENIIVETSF